MSDALTQFGYAVGVELNSTVSPLSSKLDTVISLLSSVPTSSTSRTSAGVTLPTTVAKITAISSRQSAIGMNATTGRPLTGTEHLEQSIADILLTPIGTRVMRRDYGSRLLDLIDQNMTATTVAAVFAAVADALARWEPRFSLSRIAVDKSNTSPSDGRLSLLLAGLFNGKEITVGVTA